jgi:hypothetical protein
MPKSKSTDKKSRSFTVKETPVANGVGGRYISASPFAAGKKAATKLFQKSGQTTVTFVLSESTRGSKHKSYAYTATKKVLANPVQYTVTDKTGKKVQITQKFQTKLISKK